MTQRLRNLSMGEYFLRKYERTPRPMAFDASTPGDFEAWKSEFREVVTRCLGPFPDPVDPHPDVIEVVDEGQYRREKVIFDSEPDMSVVAYVLVPNDLAPSERRPAILAAHGHGGGKDDVCGIGHGEAERVNRIAALNYDYARQFALRGYVVIAPDWRAFGERRAGGSAPNRDVCDLLQDKALLFGDNLLTLNVWDARCAVSYLQSRPEVDPDRIGCAGLSYGGTMTLFATVLDERIKCAVISGYLNRFESFALNRGNFCGAQLPIGLLKIRRDGRRRLPDRTQTAADRVGYGRQRLPHRGKPASVKHGPPRLRRCRSTRALPRPRVRWITRVERRQGIRLDGPMALTGRRNRQDYFSPPAKTSSAPWTTSTPCSSQ